MLLNRTLHLYPARIFRNGSLRHGEPFPNSQQRTWNMNFFFGQRRQRHGCTRMRTGIYEMPHFLTGKCIKNKQYIIWCVRWVSAFDHLGNICQMTRLNIYLFLRLWFGYFKVTMLTTDYLTNIVLCCSKKTDCPYAHNVYKFSPSCLYPMSWDTILYNNNYC